jgi:hypothetical protein
LIRLSTRQCGGGIQQCKMAQRINLKQARLERCLSDFHSDSSMMRSKS